uniref:Thiaminase-2/PQQC domain-containing protein n=1 Tax=Poecilia mexicana TaxID=48701 RepID=A0A3B3Z5V4_9TELE
MGEVMSYPVTNVRKAAGQEVVRDVYEELWQNNTDVAQQTLTVPFLQHMQRGDLQADDYVAFMMQDVLYLLTVTDLLGNMSRRPLPNDLKTFMQDRYQSYQSFSNYILDRFKPIPALERYLLDYRTIMDKEKPIFFAVSLLPCSRLWIWIANSLEESYCNAYFVWKKGNMHGNPEKHYKVLLNNNLKTPNQIKRANQIFRQQMQNEQNFFAASLVE